MTSFDGRLKMPGRSKLPMGVVVDLSDERMTLKMGDRLLGDWSLSEVNVAAHADGFHLEMDGESAVLNVLDPGSFANQLGIAQYTRTPPPTIPERDPLESSVAEVSVSARLGGLSQATKYDDLEGRLEAIARALRSEEVSPQRAFEHWLSLLRELNDRHEEGSIPTNIFHRFNSKLIDMMN